MEQVGGTVVCFTKAVSDVTDIEIPSKLSKETYNNANNMLPLYEPSLKVAVSLNTAKDCKRTHKGPQRSITQDHRGSAIPQRNHKGLQRNITG